MQIGLRIGPQNEFTPVPEYLEFVKRAEVLGFDPLLFSDTVSLSHFHLRDPLVVMVLAAGATTRAGLGTGVTVPFIRHPAVIAGAFGSVDDAIAPRRAFRENYDESDVGHRTKNAEYVTDYMIDRFAVVGAPEDVVARFETLRAMGIDKAIVAMPFRLEERYEIIETLAREVMPRFSGRGA